ncbi:MAG TPA: hypothetical protein VL172_03500 [Kofleriaceae bacterium]|jgi:hypothetical protein|nr:hypothetical protein [Kofleriaceae bacterium]
MADEFDLEQEVARLRSKLTAVTVITVLFMLASGGLAAAVYMKVSKKPPAPTEIRVGDSTSTAVLKPGSLELVRGAEHATYAFDRVELQQETGTATLGPRNLTLQAKTGAIHLDASATSTNVTTPPDAVVTPFSLSIVHGDRKLVADAVDDPPKIVLDSPGKHGMLAAEAPPPPPPPPTPTPAPTPP